MFAVYIVDIAGRHTFVIFAFHVATLLFPHISAFIESDKRRKKKIKRGKGRKKRPEQTNRFKSAKAVSTPPPPIPPFPSRKILIYNIFYPFLFRR